MNRADALPLVSVVIPYFMLDEHVEETLESVHAQTYPRLEVIVVNDGVGFYTTRVLSTMIGEAFTMLAEGESIEAIDHAMTDFGWPVGPRTPISTPRRRHPPAGLTCGAALDCPRRRCPAASAGSTRARPPTPSPWS